jgi:hypothetical protein
MLTALSRTFPQECHMMNRRVFLTTGGAVGLFTPALLRAAPPPPAPDDIADLLGQYADPLGRLVKQMTETGVRAEHLHQISGFLRVASFAKLERKFNRRLLKALRQGDLRDRLVHEAPQVTDAILRRHGIDPHHPSIQLALLSTPTEREQAIDDFLANGITRRLAQAADDLGTLAALQPIARRSREVPHVTLVQMSSNCMFLKQTAGVLGGIAAGSGFLLTLGLLVIPGGAEMIAGLSLSSAALGLIVLYAC